MFWVIVIFAAFFLQYDLSNACFPFFRTSRESNATILNTIDAQTTDSPFINVSLNNASIDDTPFLIVHQSEVTFRLYTREHNTTYPYITLETGNLSNKYINVAKHCKFIIHGFQASANASWYLNMTNAFLVKGDFNIIQVDWSGPAKSIYPLAARYTKSVGYYVSLLIVALKKNLGIPYTNIHLIGHSLGSHISGYAGSYVQTMVGEKIRRITGLDPAGPLFLLASLKNRLDATDASFVDIIHVDGGKLGYYNPLGHVDFYPNGGRGPQPACIQPNMIQDVLGCSHLLAPPYFIESINSDYFLSRRCFSYIGYVLRECQNSKFETAIMGENVNQTAAGRFYLNVNSKSPYAKNGEI